MYFGFALVLSDIDLRNIDLLGTHLDLLDIDIRSKPLFLYKASWRLLQGTCLRGLKDSSSRRFEGVFSVTIFHFPRRLARSLEDFFEDEELLRWRRVEDVFKKCIQDVL